MSAHDDMARPDADELPDGSHSDEEELDGVELELDGDGDDEEELPPGLDPDGLEPDELDGLDDEDREELEDELEELFAAADEQLAEASKVSLDVSAMMPGSSIELLPVL